MPQPDAALSARGVTRRYGYRVVLRDISLDVTPGDALLLVGHNGAGKTTLLRILAGLARASSGTVRRTGTVGMVAHDAMLYDELTALENLAFFSRLHGLPDAGRGMALLERLGLGAWAGERVRTFSRGMVQRLAIARALLSEPGTLLLDEPLSGLDDATSQIARRVFAEQRERGCALIVVTHHLAEMADLARTVGFLKGGRLLALEPSGGRDAQALGARYRELAGE